MVLIFIAAAVTNSRQKNCPSEDLGLRFGVIVTGNDDDIWPRGCFGRNADVDGHGQADSQACKKSGDAPGYNFHPDLPLMPALAGDNHEPNSDRTGRAAAASGRLTILPLSLRYRFCE